MGCYNAFDSTFSNIFSACFESQPENEVGEFLLRNVGDNWPLMYATGGNLIDYFDDQTMIGGDLGYRNAGK